MSTETEVLDAPGLPAEVKAKIKTEPEAPEAEPEVEAKEVTVVESLKKTPASGQSGPPGEFPWGILNDKEQDVVRTLDGKGKGKRKTFTLSELAAEAFQGAAESEKQANSWVRNSLRRLYRGSWVDKVERGVYQISTKGRAWRKKFDK